MLLFATILPVYLPPLTAGTVCGAPVYSKYYGKEALDYCYCIIAAAGEEEEEGGGKTRSSG
jgi:hypothetical protein